MIYCLMDEQGNVLQYSIEHGEKLWMPSFKGCLGIVELHDLSDIEEIVAFNVVENGNVTIRYRLCEYPSMVEKPFLGRYSNTVNNTLMNIISTVIVAHDHRVNDESIVSAHNVISLLKKLSIKDDRDDFNRVVLHNNSISEKLPAENGNYFHDFRTIAVKDDSHLVMARLTYDVTHIFEIKDFEIVWEDLERIVQCDTI